MSVLITGVGTVGIATAIKFAESGFDVIGYCRNPASSRVLSTIENFKRKIKLVTGDVRHLSRLMDVIRQNEVIGIIHTAALTHRSSPLVYPLAILSVNTFGTLNILEAARVMDLERVVYTSSAAIFGKIPPERVKPITEEEPVILSSKKSFYDVSKYSAELLVDAYHRVYDIETVTCRIQWVYGIGEQYPRDIGRFLYAVLKGKNIKEDSGGDITADYSYNRDVADGIFILYTTNKIDVPRIYNLSGGEIWKLHDIVEIINAMGPGKVTIGDGVGGRFTYLKDSIRSIPFDINKARKLGYSPRHLENALKDYAAWIEKMGNNLPSQYWTSHA